MAQRNGGDARGSAHDRRQRKRWLLAMFGDGTTCPCAHCGAQLTFDTLEQDRKVPGGPYRRDNLVPSCRTCNIRRSNRPWEFPLEMRAC